MPLAPGADMERFYAHLQEVMDEVDFRDRTTGGTHLMTRIRRLFQRCEMDQNEVNILRGLLTSVQSKRRPGRQGRDVTIYLDYAATTPVDPRVAAAMAECLTIRHARQPGLGHARPGPRGAGSRRGGARARSRR